MDMNSNNVYNEYDNNDYNVYEEPISVGSWFLTIFLTMIPILNFVMLLIWSFSGDTQTTKKNWAKAQLIWVVISCVISAISVTLLSFMIAGLSSSLF